MFIALIIALTAATVSWRTYRRKREIAGKMSAGWRKDNLLKYVEDERKSYGIFT